MRTKVRVHQRPRKVWIFAKPIKKLDVFDVGGERRQFKKRTELHGSVEKRDALEKSDRGPQLRASQSRMPLVRYCSEILLKRPLKPVRSVASCDLYLPLFSGRRREKPRRAEDTARLVPRIL